jgi:hypothetical protein
MPVTLRTTNRAIQRFEPVYHGKGKHAYGIKRIGNVYRAYRMNSSRYTGMSAKQADHPTKAAALAWCQSDYGVVRPGTIAPTTTTASFVQPAIGATVPVLVTSAAGLVVGQNVTIGSGGKYEITAIAGLSITCKNLGTGSIPGVTIPTAQAFTVVGAW